MKKNMIRLLCVLLCVLMLPLGALAERSYLIPDSDTRLLTEEELWKWDYESLGYILNEIFARHGYVFLTDRKYDQYFRTMPWYKPVYSEDNQACYKALNKTEWANEQLVKQVRADMRAMHTTNPGGKSVWSYYSAGFDTLSSFSYVNAKAGMKLPVYSAPSTSSWRGANGKAAVSTNGNVYAAGWENGWLLVMYETNNGSVRVGYVSQKDMKKRISCSEQLSFYRLPATLMSSQSLTDDPARSYTSICTLTAGSKVTYLDTYYNSKAWDYVETTYNGKKVRGFIRSGNLNISGMEEPGD